MFKFSLKMLHNCTDTQKQSVRGNIKKIVANFSQCSYQPKLNLIVLHNPHVFSGLCKTIRLDLILPNLLKYLADCLNYNAVLKCLNS